MGKITFGETSGSTGKHEIRQRIVLHCSGRYLGKATGLSIFYKARKAHFSRHIPLENEDTLFRETAFFGRCHGVRVQLFAREQARDV